MSPSHEHPALPLHLLATSPPTAPIRIGIPIDTAAHGAALITAAHLAIERHNRLGGPPAGALWHDDCRNAEGARAAAKQLMGAGICHVVGHFSSRAALAAAPLYAENDVLFIAPGASAPELTDFPSQGNVFRLFGRDDDQAAAIAQKLQSICVHQKVDIVAEDNQYGRNLSRTLATLLERSGRACSASIVGRSDKFLSSGTGPIVLCGTHEFSARLLCGLSPERPRIVTDDSFTPAFLSEAGSAADRALVAVIGFGNQAKEARDLCLEYERLNGNAPGGYFLTSYVAVDLILRALRELGNCDGPSVAKLLRSRQWPTPLGTLEFDQRGEVRGLSWRFASVEQGAFVIA